MIVNGKCIAREILSEVWEGVQHFATPPKLLVFTADPTFETEKFLSIKRARAHEAGISLQVVEFSKDTTTEECVAIIRESSNDADGVLVQFPFPQHIDKAALIAAIPPSKDVDALSFRDAAILPPVVGAIEAILKKNNFDLKGKDVVVVGDGALVGRPAAGWCREMGATVTVATRNTEDIGELTKGADVVILGAGFPNLLTPDMIKEGVVVLDAGTSEEGGVLRGDADPACSHKALLFTPVPGGIGPITVAVLLRNLVTLTRRQREDML